MACSRATGDLIAPLADRVVAHAGTALDKLPLADLVADGQLAATRATGDAQLALVNPTGVRAELDAGPVTYEELYAVQPFGLHLVTLTLTGEQLRRVLEQQVEKVLRVSRGFTYVYDGSRPAGERVDPASMALDGAPIEPAREYRVTVSSFLAAGGDGFTVLREGDRRAPRGEDVEALQAHLGALSPAAPPARGARGVRRPMSGDYNLAHPEGA